MAASGTLLSCCDILAWGGNGDQQDRRQEQQNDDSPHENIHCVEVAYTHRAQVLTPTVSHAK
jgi:hypothetical protein